MLARAARPRFFLTLPVALAGAVAIACSSSPADIPDSGGATCVSAAGCPDGGAPSYKTQILPILQQDCIPCHSPTGTAGYYETSYADVYNQRSPMLDQVTLCAMPPVGGPQLTSAQQIALTAWLECGAPDN